MSRETILQQLRQRAADELREVGTGAPFALLDFPDHRNVGDAAIWLGEEAYFREQRAASPRYVASFRAFSETALRAALPEGTIFIHGGGNFGDLYPRHQAFREHLLERFRDREIVQLPQSIRFERPEALARAARAIAAHRRFTLFVRDRVSYDIAAASFDCEVRLCPDLAFFLGPLARERAPEVDLLYLIRTDQERAVGEVSKPESHTSRVADWLVESRIGFHLRRAAGAARLLGREGPGPGSLRRAWYSAAARARTARGCRLLASGRVLITDRLHAHILGLLLDLPHAVLDNSYGKLHRFLDVWTGEAAAVYRARSLEDAERWAASIVDRPGQS